MADLNFYWRMNDYALQACPGSLARLSADEPNVTIELVKHYQYRGKERCYTIGYFWYNTHEPCWELKFVGERFCDIDKADIVEIFEMLKAAYKTLEAWSEKNESED